MGGYLMDRGEHSSNAAPTADTARTFKRIPSPNSSEDRLRLATPRLALPIGASVAERVHAVEAAERWLTAELKRNCEFLKQKLMSTERMCQQRFDSLDARNKVLEQRIERITANVDNTNDKLRCSAEEWEHRQREWVLQTLSDMEKMQNRQESFNKEITTLTHQYVQWERRLDGYVNEKLQLVEESAQETADSVSIATARAPLLHRPQDALVKTLANSSGLPPNTVGPTALGARSPKQSFIGQCMSVEPHGAMAEQVQHLSDALALWASRQHGCERRIVALESKLGIPSTDFDANRLGDRACCTDALCFYPDSGTDPGSLGYSVTALRPQWGAAVRI